MRDEVASGKHWAAVASAASSWARLKARSRGSYVRNHFPSPLQSPHKDPRPSTTYPEEQATQQNQLCVLLGALEWHLDIAAGEEREGPMAGSSLQAPHRETGRGRQKNSSPRRKNSPQGSKSSRETETQRPGLAARQKESSERLTHAGVRVCGPTLAMRSCIRAFRSSPLPRAWMPASRYLFSRCCRASSTVCGSVWAT